MVRATDIGACPFCASSAIAVIELEGKRDAGWMLAISCSACDAVGPPRPTHKGNGAIEAWNRRGPVYYGVGEPADDHLLGCPFCGGVEVRVIERREDGCTRVAVSCTGCDALGPPALAIAASAAMKAWNRRLLPS